MRGNILLRFIIVLGTKRLVLNKVNSHVSDYVSHVIEEHTFLRYLIIIPLIAVSYLVYAVIYHFWKHRRCTPDSCIILGADPLLCDPEVRKMVGCYAKERQKGAWSTQIATTIPSDLGVEDVPLDFKSQLDFMSVVGSRVLYWKLVGPKTSSCIRNNLSVQVTQCMKRAREIDDNCTMQFGSFALLKYKDGELKWWRLQNEWIPTISHISTNSGDQKQWTIRGFNLQNTTLKASTVHRKATFTVAHHNKMQSGEDVLLCNEPQLLRDSLPMFWKELYIYASNFVEVEEGIVVPLQSQAKNVVEAYWMSVLQGLINPWNMLVITSLALLSVVLGLGIHGTHNGTFGKLAWPVVAIITIFLVALWWHRHGPVKRPGDSVFSSALTPTMADSDVNVSIDTVPPPMVESDSIELEEDMVEPDMTLPTFAQLENLIHEEETRRCSRFSGDKTLLPRFQPAYPRRGNLGGRGRGRGRTTGRGRGCEPRREPGPNAQHGACHICCHPGHYAWECPFKGLEAELEQAAKCMSQLHLGKITANLVEGSNESAGDDVDAEAEDPA